MSLRNAFVAIESLTALTQERVFSVRRAVEVRATIEIVVLIISVLLSVARIRIEIRARVESLVNARLAVEKLARLTAQRCLTTVVAVKVVSAR